LNNYRVIQTIALAFGHQLFRRKITTAVPQHFHFNGITRDHPHQGKNHHRHEKQRGDHQQKSANQISGHGNFEKRLPSLLIGKSNFISNDGLKWKGLSLELL